jgi:hypothetical protein
MTQDEVAYTFIEEFVGVPEPPMGSRYYVTRCQWNLDVDPPLRQILEYRMAGAKED